MIIVGVVLVSVFLVGFVTGLVSSVLWKVVGSAKKADREIYHDMHLAMTQMETVSTNLKRASSYLECATERLGVRGDSNPALWKVTTQDTFPET